MRRNLNRRLGSNPVNDPHLLSVILSYIDPELLSIDEFVNHPSFDPQLIDYILSFWSVEINNRAIVDASMNGDIATIQFLIDEYGADLDILYTALEQAVIHGHFDIVQYLLSVGSPVSYDTTLLAIRNEQPEIGNFLLHNGGGFGEYSDFFMPNQSPIRISNRRRSRSRSQH
jgi:ankyrin repeat protein